MTTRPSPRQPARHALQAAHAAAVAVPLLLAGTLAAAEPPSLTVETHEIADLKAVFATVASLEQTNARARIGGTVDQLDVDEGDTVTQGQVIATVRDPKLPLQLAATDARLQSLDAQRKQAALELERARQLRSTGAIAQSRYDDAVTALEIVDAEIAAMKAERAVVAEQQSEGAVLAPAAGRVLRVGVVEGAVVMPGETVATIATANFVLRLNLPERHARSLKVGDPVLVGRRGLGGVLTGQPEELAQGTIRQVYPELDDGRVVADASVQGLGDLFVGERVRVLVSTGTRPALVVPPDYVERRHGLSLVRLASGASVVVQTGQPVPATADPAAAAGIEILSGLSAGDQLVKP